MVHKSYTKRLRLKNMEPNKIRCEGESEVEAVQQFLLHLWSPSCYSMKKCRDKSYERIQEGRDWFFDLSLLITTLNFSLNKIKHKEEETSVYIYVFYYFKEK
jgi:hypothetical protein